MEIKIRRFDDVIKTSLMTSRKRHCCRHKTTLMILRLHDGDLRVLGWGKCPSTLVTPIKATKVGVGFRKRYRHGKLVLNEVKQKRKMKKTLTTKVFNSTSSKIPSKVFLHRDEKKGG